MDTVNARMAYEMRLTGADDFDIAEKIGCTLDEAHALVEEYGETIPSQSNIEARRDEIRRVDVWLQRVDAEYAKGTLPIDRAVNSFVKLSKRRSELSGLDAPTRQEIEATLHNAPPGMIEDELNALAQDLKLFDRE